MNQSPPLTFTERLYSLWNIYRLPTHMLDHGLILLRRVINIEQSTSDNIQFNPNIAHCLQTPYACNNMVYILLKDSEYTWQSEAVDLVPVPATAMVYAGQTVNFRQRESSRRGQMRASGLKICIHHNLSNYQMDCLESTLIAFLLLRHGLRCMNYSIYPCFVYANVPLDLNLDDIQSHSVLLGRSTYSLLRRVIAVGTAPPITVLNDVNYRRSLGNVRNPLLNWILAAQESLNIQLLADILFTDGEEFPVFVDHYPRTASGKYTELLAALSIEEIKQGDRDLRSSIIDHRRDVIVMIGGRPTLLSPFKQRTSFLSTVCANTTVHWLTSTRCGFMFWWPDPGARGHSSLVAQHRLPRIWQLASHKLRLLLWRLAEEDAGDDIDGLGISFTDASKVLEWQESTPVSLQLRDELRQLALKWTSTDDTGNSVTPFSIESTFDDNRNAVPDPEEVEFSCLATRFSSVYDETDKSLSEVVKDWSRSRETWMTTETMRRVPNYQVLSEESQAKEMLMTTRIFYGSKLQEWLKRRIDNGLFVPFPDEDIYDQWKRCWQQILLERIQRSYVPGSTLLTCVYCNQRIYKTLQENRKVVVMTRLPGCLSGPTHTLGWELVVGDYSDMFPNENLVKLFLNTLIDGMIINHMQLCAAFVNFIMENPSHPQSKCLQEMYGDQFEAIRTFSHAVEDNRVQSSGFSRGLRNAVEKLKETCGVVIVWRTKKRGTKETRGL